MVSIVLAESGKSWGELAEGAERNGQSARCRAPATARRLPCSMPTYPDSPAYDSARAQLAGFFARSGRRADALTLYRDIVADAEGRPLPSLRSLLTPYFALLLDGGTQNGDVAGDFVWRPASCSSVPALPRPRPCSPVNCPPAAMMPPSLLPQTPRPISGARIRAAQRFP